MEGLVPLVQYLPFVGITLVLIVLFHVVYCRLTPFDDLAEIRRSNIAAGLNRGGATFGIVIATIGSKIMSPEPSYWGDVKMFAVDGLLVVIMFLAIMYTINMFVLVKVNNWLHIEQGNWAVGFVEGCIYAGQGAIMCGAFAGGGSGFWMGMLSAVVFSVLGQLTLALSYWVYVLIHYRRLVEQRLTEGDKLTAITVGTTVFANSVALGFSIAGDYTGFWNDVGSWAQAAWVSLVFVTVIRELFEFLSRRLGYGNTVASAVFIGPLVIALSLGFSMNMA